MKTIDGSEKSSIPRYKTLGKFGPYVDIARPDHWFKNVFMGLGIILAFFLIPDFSVISPLKLLLSVSAICLVASSNYVINEILDAPFDLYHPKKKFRPVPSGLINIPLGYAEWIFLACVGISLSFSINIPFGWAAVSLWIMGMFYNISPFRTKEIPYLDVLSESINNPIRLVMGWFILIPDRFPPVSLFIAYWMYGAFFMALKRFAELREIKQEGKAGAYRKSFRHYTPERLLFSVFFYAVTGSLFAGIFMVRYHLELILMLPFLSGFLTYYLYLGFKTDSPVQAPEKLYRERNFVFFTLFCLILFIVLMLCKIPGLYSLFNISENQIMPLWQW